MARAGADDRKPDEASPTPELRRPLFKLDASVLDARNLSFKAWGAFSLLVVGVATAICVVFWGPNMGFPAAIGGEIGREVKNGFTWLTVNGDWLFNGIKTVILQFMAWLEDGLTWMPWPAVVLAVGLVAWRASGVALAVFSISALVTIGFMGRLPNNFDTLWESSMETLALIVVSVLLSLLFGIPLGILAARSGWVNIMIRPILDIAQTMPSFVYLVPALL
ncbi:MAG: hypothetical protein J4G01_07540, partial [Dehalococcoidia bacterium]|nr:hypothetical protein [Dehalococcoidia bacterium]